MRPCLHVSQALFCPPPHTDVLMVFTALSFICIMHSVKTMFKANLWFAGVYQGLTVKQNWVEITDLGKQKIYICKTSLKKMKKKNQNFHTSNKLQYDPLLHSHLWFPKAAGYSRLDLQSRYREQTACGSQVCSSRAHFRDYLHLCFKNTGC